MICPINFLSLNFLTMQTLHFKPFKSLYQCKKLLKPSMPGMITLEVTFPDTDSGILNFITDT